MFTVPSHTQTLTGQVCNPGKLTATELYLLVFILLSVQEKYKDKENWFSTYFPRFSFREHYNGKNCQKQSWCKLRKQELTALFMGNTST